MSHVYRERHEIPIPEGAHINHFDARVYLMEESTRKRTVIGVATSESTMHPNDMYRKLYPEAWGPPKIKSDTVSPSISHEVMGPDAMIFIF